MDRAAWAKLIPYLKGYTTHVIAAGETLWGIADTYDTSVSAILTANPSLDAMSLQIGTRIYVPFSFELVDERVPYTSSLTDLVLEGLKVRYPFLISGCIGKSVMGRDVCYLQFGEGETQVCYNACFHANEWITTPILLSKRKVAYRYLLYYYNLRRACEIQKNARVRRILSYGYGRTRTEDSKSCRGGNVEVKTYIDGVVGELKRLWKLLDISYDKFIRTTDEEHEKAVQKIFKKLYDKGDIYKSEYEGWYCTPCEAFWTKTQLVDGKCPDCGRSVDLTKEESYFFKLSNDKTFKTIRGIKQ